MAGCSGIATRMWQQNTAFHFHLYVWYYQKAKPFKSSDFDYLTLRCLKFSDFWRLLPEGKLNIILKDLKILHEAGIPIRDGLSGNCQSWSNCFLYRDFNIFSIPNDSLFSRHLMKSKYCNKHQSFPEGNSCCER